MSDKLILVSFTNMTAVFDLELATSMADLL